MNKLIIGLVGEKLAGKDTVAEFLVKNYGAFHIKFSHILDEIIDILDMPKTRRNEIDLGLGLREVFGPSALYKALKKRIEISTEPKVVINGIRMDEFDKIVKELGAKTIYVTAPLEVRFARYLKRHEKVDDGKMNFEEFAKQDREELTEKDIPQIGARANYKIENTGSLEELNGKVKEIIKELI